MKQMNEAIFREALAGGQLVLVEYWAPWCVYCRRIEAATAKVAEQFRSELVIGQVNIDEEPLLSHQEQIEVIPTFVLYKDGKAVSSIVAPESKAAIEEFLREGLK
jgi:thioredoxin-like negative regulator of GroEL